MSLIKKGDSIYLFGLAVALAILAPELVNTAGSVNKPLLPRIEGVTVGTDLHMDLLGSRGMCLLGKTAGTLDLGLFLLGMNILFHKLSFFE